MSVTELGISGMSCASCASHVTAALKGVDGVTDASVNLATERATVQHGPNVAASSLIDAVERAGYEASAQIDEEREEAARALDLHRMRSTLILALALFVPTMLLAMFAPAFPFKDWLLAALTLPVWGYVGWEFHGRALNALRAGTTTMDTLVSLGSTAAFGLSLYGAATHTMTYFETAGAIVTLVYLGRYLEAVAHRSSNLAMHELLALRPSTAARRAVDGSVLTVPVESLVVGDVVVVAAGERIPVDGVVIEGFSAIDRSMLTGESMPVDVEPHALVNAGTLNGDGTLTIRSTAIGAGTELSRIVELVRKAQGSTPPVQRLADRIAGVFVPAILIIALATFAGWMISGHDFNRAVIAAVAVLVVACPCALGLATPTAVIAGVGAAARRGIIFKDASSLERTARVDLVAIDKTGTLTRGVPQVSAIDSKSALALAAALERGNSHPLARAIVDMAQGNGVPIPDASNVQTVRGLGVTGTIDGKPAAAGSSVFLASLGVAVPQRALEQTAIYVAHNGLLAGRIDFADAIRDGAAATVTALRRRGVDVVLISGDAEGPVKTVAGAAGISEWHASALPQDKAELVREAQRRGRRVAFVGDGINDAPALASADAGFAMGSGSATALEVASAAIVSDDPRCIVEALDVARNTMRTIAQNLFWAFAYNVVLVPLAVIGIVTPVFAAAAMGLSSLFVVGNSLRLSRRGG